MKNLFIVFPGGCGGNHLANLISLNNKFTPRFKSNNYHQELLNHYKENCSKSLINSTGELYESPHGIKAHFAEYNNLDQLKNNATFNELINSKTINILIGHEHDFQELEFNGRTISKIPDPFYIIMSYPKFNSLAYNRIQLYKFTPDPKKYTFPFRVSYDELETEWPVADDSNGMFLETEKFIAENGCDYIKDKLLKINIELHDLAYEIHKIWYNKLIEILTLYNVMPTKYSNEYHNLN